MTAKSPSIAGYRNLLEICRKSKRYDAWLRVLGEAIEHVGSLEPLAEKGHPLADDKELVAQAIDSARARLKADSKAFPYESRLAAAVLALDAKQYDAASEFFNAAIQAKPDQAAQLLLTWGLGLVLREQHAPGRRGLPPRGGEKALPAEDPTFHYYLAGALEMAGQTEDALAAARKAVATRLHRETRRAARQDAAGQADPCRLSKPRCLDALPRQAIRRGRQAYHELIEKFDPDYGSAEIREVCARPGWCCPISP